MQQYKTQGILYDPTKTVKEIAQMLRTILKNKYPKCKFSTTSSYNSIDITLTQANYSPFIQTITPEIINKIRAKGFSNNKTDDEIKAELEKRLISPRESLNHYYIKDNYILNDKAKEMFEFITKMADAYNFDDSEIQTDYFHSNFYFNLQIGSWDKPFIIINK